MYIIYLLFYKILFIKLVYMYIYVYYLLIVIYLLFFTYQLNIFLLISNLDRFSKIDKIR